MPRPVKWILGALIAVGFARGVIHFNDANDTNVLGRLVVAIVGIVEDFTYRWIGVVAGWFSADGREWVNNAVPSFFRALTGGS